MGSNLVGRHWRRRPAVSFGIFPRTAVAFEVRLLSSVIYLIAGLILLVRSKGLASRIVEDLETDDADGATT